MRVADKLDRRQNLIELTPYALEIKDDATKIAMAAVNLIIKDIPTHELYVFIKVHPQMGENMNNEPELINLELNKTINQEPEK